ncbi:hypothetical protein CKAN_01372200 [Cinnamomum micranthum f. kanehirae]|uniref:Uncharacterized protein n=1 Tax=Cinnamomum micranthum f. kanehirae TaxID=337451 RepID=A0A443P252_9MAGN|nr:hypothetical protein CKAN_01372200 [Cinnamomum micranthum f. kanehirae]
MKSRKISSKFLFTTSHNPEQNTYMALRGKKDDEVLVWLYRVRLYGDFPFVMSQVIKCPFDGFWVSAGWALCFLKVRKDVEGNQQQGTQINLFGGEVKARLYCMKEALEGLEEGS